jgi:cytochrome c5
MESAHMQGRMMFSILRLAGMLILLGVGAIGASALHAQSTTAPAPVQWTKVSVELPSSDATFPAGDGADVANGYCLMCHSAGMVLRQPPLTQSQWLGEIKKMRAFWGSLLPPDQDEALARYLAGINGPGSGK